jgi:2-dehydropantoate 2-reductase
MRIAFMGSGGLGGYFGARLCQGGADVHFIARGSHLQAMRREGLRVEGPEHIHIPRVAATDDPAEVGVVDFVMLCVKLWDTEAALQQIHPMVGAGTTIISFQNGVLKDQYLRAAYDASQIMGGVGYVATTIDRPGVIRQTGPMQRLLFGEFDGSRSARGQALLEACLAGGIKAELSENILARSGRSTCSWSGSRGPRRRFARPSARSANIRRHVPSCLTSCARSLRSAEPTAWTCPRTTLTCASSLRTMWPMT